MTHGALAVAGVAGLAASLLARYAAEHCRRALGQKNRLPEIAADVRRLIAGTDTNAFLAEYFQLLRRLGQVAAGQLVMLSANLVTVTAVYAIACWPLEWGAAAQSSNPLRAWVNDIEFSFLVAAVLGSIAAPWVIRSSA